jgi:glycosyltransferase involved in cell wall biosynthesis
LPVRPTLAVVIPALNEEDAIGPQVAAVAAVLAEPGFPAEPVDIVVVDNGSTDATAERAAAAGATVVAEPRRGYGRACLSGAEAAVADLLIFMDGDGSDDPADLPRLLEPLLAGTADLVLGSRTKGSREPGSLLPQQVVGNWVGARLLLLLYGVRVTDLPPLRAIRRADLLALGMREMTYGWPVEMIARAAQRGLRIAEIPAAWRNRAGGVSKVSGNLRASVRASGRILTTIARCRLTDGVRR